MSTQEKRIHWIPNEALNATKLIPLSLIRLANKFQSSKQDYILHHYEHNYDL